MRARFELDPKLTQSLKRYAADTTLPEEFLVEDALVTAMESLDSTLMDHLREDYADAVRKKTHCRVTALESEGDE